ncbi:Zinc finger mynd domain-containing protein 17 [Mycena sanguinolenta]|uniref:Zinc finger mynd domain-containing protein 17 n=1 Tax=Mycena sanguinolenta TaxID=230812 RepID=A0A8H6YQP2_9AGAR|nr:Zinc finger mynd domain-containing protein 17 [Mycena sanguinolenta]
MELGPIQVVIGLACRKCRKDEDVELSRCGGCRRISYCGTVTVIAECQSADWERHKPMCKALTALEKNSAAAARLVSLLPKQPLSDLREIRKLTDKQVDVYFTYLQGQTALENSWIHYEPRCLVCTRTEMVMRMETGAVTQRLIPCPRCMRSFCCSPAHWEAAHALHHSPSTDWRDGFSHCQMNTFARLQEWVDAGTSTLFDRQGQLVWVPGRIKSRWVSLEGKTWEGEFDEEIRTSYGIPATIPSSSTFLLSSASDTLSMPMTILYGLSKLNEDDSWTRKQTLTVHVLGASDREVSCRPVFEEILHRLPGVDTLEIVLCGPEVPSRDSFDHEICPECIARGRSCVLKCAAELVFATTLLLWITDYSFSTYHDFVRKQGNQFKTPDLCVAFNSGAAQHVDYTWRTSIKVLAERKLPSLFTAYCREEAEQDAAMIRAAGAALHPALGPCLNPWGSQKALPTAHSVYGFHTDNAWLAGGFK